MLSLPHALLEQVAAFVPCRETRAALGYCYEKCITLKIPPCPLQPPFKSHLERLVAMKQHGWGFHIFYPARRISVWLCFETTEDMEWLLITVTTDISFNSSGHLRQSQCGEVRDLHIMFGDVTPRTCYVHRSTRPAGFDFYDAWDTATVPWFNWFVRLEDREEVMPLKAYFAIKPSLV